MARDLRPDTSKGLHPTEVGQRLSAAWVTSDLASTLIFIVRKKLQLDASLYVVTDSFRLDFREIRAFMPRAARFWKIQEMWLDANRLKLFNF